MMYLCIVYNIHIKNKTKVHNNYSIEVSYIDDQDLYLGQIKIESTNETF